MNYDNPIFLDFETQSACDISEYGGRLYAEHESTRILILCVAIDNIFHVWIPDYIKVNTSLWKPERLWPYQLKPKHEVRLYRGEYIPQEIIKGCHFRSIVAHNAYGFDKHIWDRFIKLEAEWIDSLYLARIAGRPGRLDTLGKQILGQGKDRASKLLPELTTAFKSKLSSTGYRYPIIKPGDMQAFTTYAIADVEIIRQLYAEFDSIKVEEDVITTHNNINNRGVEVDRELLEVIESLSRYSVSQAENEIAELTDGKLGHHNLRSTQQVHAWLDSYGITITDDSGKPCLRKEIVQRFLDSPYILDDYLLASREVPPFVLEVLKLRMKALRITDAKVKKAQERIHPDGRIRDLHAYHVAGPGRWSSFGVQIHNLPRPIKGIDIEECIKIIKNTKLYDSDVAKLYELLKRLLPKNTSIDDLCSSLIRPSFVAGKGKAFCIADFSKIEAVCLAWLAGEERLLQSFRNYEDVYRQFASYCFNCDEKSITPEQRNGVGKVGVLGLGYGMGAHKARIFAANNGVDLTKAGITAEDMVETYRSRFTNIAGFKPKNQKTGMLSNFRVNGIWQRLDKAVKKCVSDREEQYEAKTHIRMDGRNMVFTLPSGREIHYPNARIEDVIPPYCYTMNLPLNPKATVVYDSNRGTKSLYGGLETENIDQGTCRDLLAIALVKLDKYHCPVLHVHDEPICEVEEKKAEKRMREMVEIMSDVPKWAEGFPIACEGFISPRFVKEPFKGYKKIGTRDISLIQSKGLIP